MAGSFIPFARTKAERVKAGDPRLSIEEVQATAHVLVQGRYLLERDVPLVMARASAEWDFVTR